jgi:hypothetical protein
MFIILGWHTPWTWHDLGEPVASVVALPVALCALYLMLIDSPAAARAGSIPPPGPGRVLRAVIGAISCGAIAAALCVIGRYWTGPVLARWAWVWGVRWMLPVLIVVIALTLSTRRQAGRPVTPHSPPPSLDGPGEAPGGTTPALEVSAK